MKNIENRRCIDTLEGENTLQFFKSKAEKLEDENHELEDKNHALYLENELLKAKIDFYEEQMRLANAKKFAASSEKISDHQLCIFNEAEKESAKPFEELDIEDIIIKRKKGRSKTRKTYDDLDIEEIVYDLSPEEKICPKCQGPLHHVRHEVRKELKYIPAKIVMVHHKKEICGCRYCETKGTEGTLIKAQMPNPVIEKSMVSPSLLAALVEMKYNRSLPLYRQQQAFENYGIDMPRQNMASWMIKSSEKWLKPLYDRLRYYLLQEDIIHADETVLKVIDEKDNKTNYMWLYASCDMSEHKIILYDYQKSRGQSHPKRFLKGFKGYLQTDGYGVYNKIPDVINAGCLAHCRRKFTDALKAMPKEAISSQSKSSEAIDFLKKVYKYEKSYKMQGFSQKQRYEHRLIEVKPVMDDFKAWLDQEKNRTLPKSALGKAIAYSLNQWPKLIIFLKDGRIDVDNNLAERAIKNFVIGRKNFMFSKSPKGATASGIMYSMVVTAKAHGLKPMNYLEYLYTTLPNIDIENIDELDACLPWALELPDDIKIQTHNASK